jgi:putative ABC transport system permease protein
MSGLLLKAGLRHYRHHPWQAALALIGIVMGVAVVIAVDIANQAARSSFERSAEQVRGTATHRIVGAGDRVPDALYRQLFVEADMPPMAPVIQARIRAADDTVMRLLGLDVFAEAAFRPLLGAVVEGQGALGDWLADPAAVVLDRSAADHLGLASVGDALVVRFEGRPHELRVFAIGENASLASRDLLVVDLATAQALTGMGGQISYIDLALEEGTAAAFATRLPPGVELVAIDEQTAGVVGLSRSFELNLTAMGLLALLVGLFLIYNAMSFAVVQRRRLLGRLRAIGVTREQIRTTILAEAAVLGLAGTLLGILAGWLLGDLLTRIVAATISDLYYEVTIAALPFDLLSAAKGALLGLAGTLVASALPAFQAARTPPLTTLSRAALEEATRRLLPQLTLFGLVLATVGLVAAFHLPGGLLAGFAGLFLFLVGAALMTPSALHLVHRLALMLPLRGVARMAARDLDRHLSRLGTAVAALMIALSASVGIAVMVESMRDAVSTWLDDLLTADLYVSAEAFDQGAPLPDAVSRGLPRLAGVTAFSSYRDNRVLIGDRPVTLVAVELAPRSRQGFAFLSQAGEGAWSGFDAGGILISEPLAHRLAITAGMPLSLPGPGGPLTLPIAGVFRDYATENGRIFMPRARYVEHWQDDTIDTLALFADISPAELQDRIQAAYADSHALAFTAAREIYDLSMRIFDETFRITEVLRVLALLVAFVGIFSALMAVQLERRKEYAVLRAIGWTPAQIARLILLTTLLFGLVAGLTALPVGMVMAWVLTDAIQLRAFGWSMPFTVQAAPLLWILALGTFAAVLAGIYPAYRAARTDPAPQLRED